MMERDMMNGQMSKDGGMRANTCKCPHHKMIPLLVVLFALLFLLKALGTFSEYTVSIVWPILLGAAGLMKMFEYKCKCC